jgi:hypothetical protein
MAAWKTRRFFRFLSVANEMAGEFLSRPTEHSPQPQEADMTINAPKDGAPGTTEQSPRWEGPEETRPRGYLPAKDNPDVDRDAVAENLQDPRKRNVSDGMKTKDDK